MQQAKVSGHKAAAVILKAVLLFVKKRAESINAEHITLKPIPPRDP